MLRRNGKTDGIRNILLGPLENRRSALPGLCCTTGPLGYRDASSFFILSIFVPIPFPIIPRLLTPPTLAALYTLAIAVNTACHLTFLPERLYNSLAYICLLPFGSRRLCCRRGGFFYLYHCLIEKIFGLKRKMQPSFLIMNRHILQGSPHIFLGNFF